MKNAKSESLNLSWTSVDTYHELNFDQLEILKTQNKEDQKKEDRFYQFLAFIALDAVIIGIALIYYFKFPF